MMELTIKGEVYEFHFGMGFLRETNKLVTTPVDGVKDINKNVGLHYMIASIMDGDLEALTTVLDIANKGRKPRVTRDLLDFYIDDESTDVDALFEEVMDFLKSANATKKVVANLMEAVEAEKAKKANL